MLLPALLASGAPLPANAGAEAARVAAELERFRFCMHAAAKRLQHATGAPAGGAVAAPPSAAQLPGGASSADAGVAAAAAAAALADSDDPVQALVWLRASAAALAELLARHYAAQEALLLPLLRHYCRPEVRRRAGFSVG